MNRSAVYTVGEICRKCYSCVRACPTNAIEVHSGQADIIDNLCVSCGYCVNMCSQNAKRIRSSIEKVLELLDKADGKPVYALVAPSFPSAFIEVPYSQNARRIDSGRQQSRRRSLLYNTYQAPRSGGKPCLLYLFLMTMQTYYGARNSF